MSTVKTLSKLQWQIILWSVLYYNYDYSEVSDFRYNEVAKQLMEAQKSEDIALCQQTKYWYAMSDFDSCTGYDLYSRLTATDKERFDAMAKNVLFDQGILEY